MSGICAVVATWWDPDGAEEPEPSAGPDEEEDAPGGLIRSGGRPAVGSEKRRAAKGGVVSAPMENLAGDWGSWHSAR